MTEFRGEVVIDLKSVRYLAFFPERARPSYLRVYRWVTRGVYKKWLNKRVLLRARQDGGRWVTSEEAVKEFLEMTNRRGK